MTGINLSSFYDEFEKIAKLDPAAIQAMFKRIAKSSGEAGARAVPKSVPKTLVIGKGGVKRVPHPGRVMPPPTPVGT